MSARLNSMAVLSTNISNEDLEFLQRIMGSRAGTNRNVEFDLIKLKRGLVGYHRKWESTDPAMQFIKRMKREL